MIETLAPDPVRLDHSAKATQLPPAVRAGLADPLARMAVRTVTRDGGRRLDCYAVAGAGEQLAAVTPNDDGETAVSFPVDASLIEALIVETLGLDQPLADIGHRSELDAAALWALAAMADAHRQVELESLLARTPGRLPALDEDTIYLRALDGATLPDPRWLSGMLAQLNGPCDVTEARLLEGLAMLARIGLIARGPTGLWSPQPAFVAAFAHLEMPLSGVHLSIDRRGADGIEHGTFVFLRSVAAVWIIELRGAGHVLLRSASAGDLLKFAHDAITLAFRTDRPQSLAAARIPTAPARFCPQCGRPIGTAARFCGECGAALA